MAVPYGSTLDMGSPRWRCLVGGCPVCGVWQYAERPGEALADHHLEKHHADDPDN